MRPLLLVLIASFPTLLAAEELLCRTQMMMGTYAELCAPQSRAEVLQQGFQRLKTVELALSSYDERADIYRLNHEHRVSLQPDTLEALEASLRYYDESDGYFNIAIGSVTKQLYRFGEVERLPERGALQRADTHITGLSFNLHRATVAEGTTIDLGGMGKGFGVDKAYEHYRVAGVTSGKIALSGDIRCVGICHVAVTNPFEPEGVIASFKTTRAGLGISTSGSYRRYVKTKAHNHLIDPKTKRSASLFASVTVVGNIANADLDAYATAASVMPLEQAIAFLDSKRLGYLLFTMDHRRIVSANIAEYAAGLTYHYPTEDAPAPYWLQPLIKITTP